MSLSLTREKGAASPAASPPDNRPTLHIVSHNTSIPTDLDLRYDARVVANPPHDTCAMHTGLSRTVQEGLLCNERYRIMVDMAEAQIREEMGRRVEGADADGERVRLNVGCMCGSGHHRSVAMAEELGMRDWDGWKVEVTHRDLTSEVMDSKSMTRDAKRGMGRDVVSE